MRSRFPVFATLLLTLATASAARANTTADGNNPLAGDGVCQDPCSLRGAIEAAQARAGDDAIVVPAGHYVLQAIGMAPSSITIAPDPAGGSLAITGAGATGLDLQRAVVVGRAGLRTRSSCCCRARSRWPAAARTPSWARSRFRRRPP